MTEDVSTTAVPREAAESMPLVWMYHSIAPRAADPYEVTMTPGRFLRQMTWLRNRRLQGVSMANLLSAAAKGRGRGLVGLTFDDGYADFLPNALPVLKRFGFTATVFVLAGRLGGENEWSRPGPVKQLLGAEEIREIDRAGMEIGSHGLRHISLPGADDAELRAETFESRWRLAELLDHEVAGFCYPYGYVDARVIDAARAARYDYACAVTAGPQIGRHAIPRTLVHEGDTSWRLEAKRFVSKVTVGNRLGVHRHRRGQ